MVDHDCVLYVFRGVMAGHASPGQQGHPGGAEGDGGGDWGGGGHDEGAPRGSLHASWARSSHGARCP